MFVTGHSCDVVCTTTISLNNSGDSIVFSSSKTVVVNDTLENISARMDQSSMLGQAMGPLVNAARQLIILKPPITKAAKLKKPVKSKVRK